ncbi:isoleucine--tRNA ligase [Candidatus Woesearchaeota archaeon]|nr:isoleucine--tRNA ligase [Candidatus Woesearchaeota archaeon]
MAGASYNYKEVEEEVLTFWKDSNAYPDLKQRRSEGKPFYFLDGPPYTSGKVHIGTAWNKSLKDMILRYKRMRGFKVWDRAGYDMHGLPVEHKVEEKFGIKHKEEIPVFGVERFVTECRKLALENLQVMNTDFERMGIWMDFENCYKSIETTFIEGVWWMVKKAHENNRLYEGEMSLSWCANCATALAKHELEYQNIRDTSIFLKFPVVGTQNEFLIIWTTTPWTIPFNMGVMVNPELDYVKADVGGEVWVVAKSLANILIGGIAQKQYTIKEEFKGEFLKGVKYLPPFESILKSHYDAFRAKSDKVHSVVLSEEFVDASAGSGLVHMATGCGPEDFAVGRREHIPPFNNLDEEGHFPSDMGPFAGFIAKKDDKKFIEALEKTGFLIATNDVEHDYAHCWRCHKPIIYKTTTQWFFKVEDLKENMKQLNNEVLWVPDWAGARQFNAWLDHLRDNGITRQRYWGTPVPIWKCDSCKEFVVIGSADELKTLAGKIPEDLHKPWIDNVEIPCACGGKKKRLPDILDVWIDAGSASWNCLNYPREKQHFNEFFPADFILEGKDQIRGWFNLLMVASMVTMQRPSFKAVYMHGFVQDSLGRKMSKSLGNYIVPEEVISKFGADTLRYYMISGANPAIDLNYNFEDMKIKYKNLGIFWNLHRFVLDYAKNSGTNPKDIDPATVRLGTEEKYILSKMHSTIEQVTQKFEDYVLNEIPLILEGLMLELSRGYLQMVREKSATGDETQKQAVLYTAYTVFMNTLKMFSVVAPFITEKMYINYKNAFDLDEASVHHLLWPAYDESMIDEKLEEQMQAAQVLIQGVLALREQCQEGVRWPLQKLMIITEDADATAAVDALSDIIKQQTNIKEIVIQAKFQDAIVNAKVNYTTLRESFGSNVAKIIGALTEKSPKAVYKHIMDEGSYALKVDGSSVQLAKEHFTVEMEIPKQYAHAVFRYGELYLDKTKTPELEAEGYVREVMRRIQNLRKTAGLEKPDRIELHLSADEELRKAFALAKKLISEKVGATKMDVAESAPTQPYDWNSEEKIKAKVVGIWARKV